MEKNCLASFYDVSIADNNLPVVNTLFFDYPGYSVQNIVLNFAVVTGNSPVKIELASAMHKEGYAGDLVTELTLPANANIRFTSKTQDLGSSPISDFIKISGGIYELKGISAFGFNDISIMDCKPSQHNSVNSLKYAPNLITFGGMNVDYKMLPSSLKYLVVGNTSEEDINIDNIPVSVQRVDSSRILTTNNYAQFVELTEGTRNLSSLRIVKARLIGVLTDLPKGVKVLEIPSYQLTGELEDFASMTGQATSGCIAIKSPTSSFWENVTQHGTSINTLTVPVIDGYAYFTWNNGTYEWASSQPAGMDKYITAAASNPQRFVPIEE